MARAKEFIQFGPVFDVWYCRERAHYSLRHFGAHLCKASWTAWRSHQGHLRGKGKNLRWPGKISFIWIILETDEEKRPQEKARSVERKKNCH